MSETKKTASSRLLSLDVLRGITIAGMMLVNNPGSWSYVYAPLGHAQWNGLTPTDLVFPFFMFIMGVSMFLSFKKFDFKISKDSFVKLLRRSVLLFLIGLAIGWLGLTLRTYNNLRSEELDFFSQFWQSATNFENLRILGVLQRLALVSFFGTLIVLLVRPKRIPLLIGLILMAYWLIIAFTNSYQMSEESIIAVIDRAILGASHMYHDTTAAGVRIPFDPEGILSTIPCLAHVLLGYWAGKLMSETKNLNEKIQKLFVFGTIILFAGFLLDYGFPINKKIWSISFVLTTCGLASLFLGLLIWIIDIKGFRKWAVFFESFGVNPMFVYVVGAVLGILIGNLGFTLNGDFIAFKTYIFNNLIQPTLGDYPGSLVFALLFVSVCWAVGHVLYKKKIFIKL
ncbi:MAG: acyltransferase family protein [Paludibacter sp.]